MGRLDGATAIVSGGARGQGAAHVRGLLEEGANVVFGDVLEQEGAALAEELASSRVRFTPLDVTDERAWTGLVDLAEREFGPVGILINNAGVASFSTIEDTSAEEFRRVLDINLAGVHLGMRAAIPSLRRAGSGIIVNVSSAAGMIGLASNAAYVASKWAVRGLTKGAALELGPQGVRVVSIHPGPIRTPMIEGFGEESWAAQALPRCAEPEEVTKLILFLISDATYSTGCEFVIDGGFTLGAAMPPRDM